jgi:diguanylate cyclase (GGDEF)-like protein
MLFNLFAPRNEALDNVRRMKPNVLSVENERSRLAAALNLVLETLPQSHSGHDSVKMLCNQILRATSHLRYVWVGFCEGNATQIKPYSSGGDCSGESADWRLPSGCFDGDGPYMQAQTGEASAMSCHSLFQPWQADPKLCSARSALAIPLRSFKRGLRGVIVFYADTLDYFSAMGVAAFKAFCNCAEIIWSQSNLKHMVAQKSQQDALTGLLNRRHMMRVLEDRISVGGATRDATSIVLCRIDGFDNLNSLYGWNVADDILTAFARQAMEVLGTRATGARWTGVEFLFLLQSSHAGEIGEVADRLARHFMANPVRVENSVIRLALSIGHATYSGQMLGADDLILEAVQETCDVRPEFASSML